MNQLTPASRAARVARLMVADDHDVIRAGFAGERYIELVGEAANGRDALALCRRVRPDVVLLDVRMPDMDGLAVTRAIKHESPSTSVVLFTMYETADYLVEALKAGASGYLLKGASKREIMTAIRQVLAGETILHPELVLQLLRRFSGEPRNVEEQAQLTRREQDVLRLVALGQTNRQIAETLSLTVSTIKTHVEHVIGKLGVSDRTQAAVRAIELGLVSAANHQRLQP
jgi:DNA-binding NarL/FixJ family response regulator